MKKLEKNKNEDQYIKEKYTLGKYLYFCDSRESCDLYYIFKCEKILSNMPLEYETSRCYYFMVPKNNNCKCFLYDNILKVKVPSKATLYKLSFEEFVNTFRAFIENDKKYPNELPDKLIQDYI